MDGIATVLLDVYETALTCNFGVHAVEMPRLAGVPESVWNRWFYALADDVMTGRLTLHDAFSMIIRDHGVEPTPALIEQLVLRDEQLLLQSATLYDDTITFLDAMRQRGIKVAIVSNCADNTAALLDHLGITPQVDAVVLSCRVGFSKPAPEIYAEAMRQLGTRPAKAVLIDDQESYCSGARALGIRTLRIRRGVDGLDVGEIGSLTEASRILYEGSED